ncbi:MAG: DNA polymerase III subunit delta [Bacteroidia bacterium]
MAATYKDIITGLEKKLYHPVYFFCGEEPYYIDMLSQYIEKNVLDEGEREFNQMVFYGRENSIATVLDAAYRFPMMSNYQVIIVKEAQEMKDLFTGGGEDKNMLLTYLEKPQKSTILVFCYKYKKLDMRTSAAKKLSKSAVFFESARLYDRQIPAWIEGYIKDKGYIIGPKALALLAEYLGSDLSKIANELGKLMINLTPPAEITAADIESNIGISKDYNIFELQTALGNRDMGKALQIVEYFASNTKDNPFVMSVVSLYNYFSKLFILHSLKDKSRNNVAAKLGVAPYFVGDYEKAGKAYSPASLQKIFHILREYDLKSKGVGNATISEEELYKEFILKLIYVDKVPQQSQLSLS